MASKLLVLTCALFPAAYAQEILWKPLSELPASLIQPMGMVSGMTAEDMNCFSTFAAFNFNITDYPSFPEFFDDNSVVILPPAGEYKGVDAITEYMKFPTAEGGVTASSDIVDLESGYFGIENGLCSFYQWMVSDSVATALGGHHTRRSAIGTKLLFNANTSKLDFVYAVYMGTHLSTYWGLHDTTAAAEFVCQIMEDKCAAAFALANLTSQADCLQRYNSLPMLSGDYWFDGNSKSCRLMHASFVVANPQHCPHISFESQTDHMGKIKCQTSQFIPVNHYLSSSEWQSFMTFAANKGLPDGIIITTPSPAPVLVDSCPGRQAAAAVALAILAALYS